MQQINLYLPEFQPNREPLRSVQMLWGLGLFLLLLTGLSMVTANGNRERESALAQDRIQLEQLKTRMVQLEQQRPRDKLADLDEQIALLAQDLERHKQILAIVSSKDLGNNTGFSLHLLAMGRQSLDTISLSVFSLELGGNYVEFVGRTRAADQIPLYIQRLRSEPVFSQTAFGVINIEPVKNSQGVFEFSLAKQHGNTDVESASKTAVQTSLERNRSSRGAL